jgi:hypothetical protein
MGSSTVFRLEVLALAAIVTLAMLSTRPRDSIKPALAGFVFAIAKVRHVEFAAL